MNRLDTVKAGILNLKHAKVVAIFSITFSLIYHISMLFLFLRLNVRPLFYFNIFSVALFGILQIIVFRKKTFVIPFAFAYVEVVIHQILADYFLGGDASFHFFIMLMGILPFITFDRHFALAAFYSIISTIGFIFLETIRHYFTPRYEISERVLFVLKVLNVSFSCSVICLAVFIFAYIVWHTEQNLQFQVEEKTREIQKKNEKLVSLQNQIINSLASLVENRDGDTGSHILRTSAYVEIIARKAYENGLWRGIIDEQYIELIKSAAPMHDIGKIVVPDSILKKPGKLTDEEFDQMKLHTTEGRRIIEEIVGIAENKNYVKIASEIATSHHERWDGRGYPYQHAAEEIPLSARIMAVADVFDALVSTRCYKKPMDKEDAFRIIEEESGTHFDPVVVELFMEARPKIEKILAKYAE